RHGTPAYQAPEQLTGDAVSVQTDLFALGLVLYEMFTGKRAFDARQRDELLRQHEGGTPAKPSSHVTGLNPALEQVILRCLEKDPRAGAAWVYQVLAGLRGGDPLQAALAAGQTPSPEVVANANVEGTLRLGPAVALLGACGVGLLLIALLANQVRLF